MKFGVLLENLIEVAKIPKTDFAIGVDMTPSGLSKLLSGKRLPFYKERKIFCKKAASCLVDEIYADRCYLKFEDVFPVVYDFKTRQELEAFLSDAIDYSLMWEYAAENRESMDYPDRETSVLGKKAMLNMFCVILSDALSDESDASLEFFSSTYALFQQLCGETLGRIRLIGSKSRKRRPVLNHYFDMASLENSLKTSRDTRGTGLLSLLVAAHRYFDLNLWQTQASLDSAFLLLKNRFLLVFTLQLDGSPIMTLIRHKSYLSAFSNMLVKRDAEKISYDTAEASALVKSGDPLFRKLLDGRMDEVYNFISIGYLVGRAELKPSPAPDAVKDFMLKLFNGVLTKNTDFYVTVEAMMSFYATGKAIVPLVGVIDFPPEQRVAYLQRFDSYLHGGSDDKIKLLNSEPPKVAVFCMKGMNAVYVLDGEHGNERIHCFETDLISSLLRAEIADGRLRTMNFTPELWSVYIDELSNSLSVLR